MDVKDVNNQSFPKELEDNIIFEAISGSHAYGTANEFSDIDIRGIFALPQSEFLGLRHPTKQFSDDKNDVIHYELRRFFELICESSPNMLEMLWMPEDCIRICKSAMDYILQHKSLFLSKKAFYTFSGYAYSQIKRAKGQNKWINNPQPETSPNKEDFCWIIDADLFLDGNPPCRPTPLRETSFNLSLYHAAKLEHVENSYRIYFYDKDAKGVFRDGQLVCESIPVDDESLRFDGILIYNKPAYEAAMRDWKNYWEWRENRNEARYRSQEAGETDYDCKNIMHCMRLLWSGENILVNGEPIVRFEGEKLQVLKDIRNGKYKYDEVMQMVEGKMEDLNMVLEKSTLPKAINMKSLEKLYFEVRDSLQTG
jgi:predicted nucleotidyltransferase